MNTPPDSLRILGIDASLRSTGLGIVEAEGSRMRSVWHGRVRNPAARPLSACLVALEDAVCEQIVSCHPQAAAIEGVFFSKNIHTTLILGHARGVLIGQCARHGIPVYEYEPRRVKQAVVGFGGAVKGQMQRMVMTLLNLPELPQEDEADALALAICHLHNRTRLKLSGIEPL
ncbi:MAG: crossover junction endodeoxyribonuclease RuvC [Lentisphaerae bacterium]|nr:crossover junction endodeoxyribonuclease RuvC [Lentisphaerota bacterium]